MSITDTDRYNCPKWQGSHATLQGCEGGNNMSISISAKNDYSYLFSSMNKASSSGSVADMSWLGDYASIKSGSYGKLLKAYYAKDSDSDPKSAVSKIASDKLTQDENTKTYTKAASGADALQKSIASVGDLADDADDEAVYNAVNSFVKSYNDVVDSASATTDSSITNRLTAIETTSGSYEKKLNSIGISIRNDGTLKLDKDTFMAADKSTVKELFDKRGSYGSNVNVSAAMIQSTANFDATRGTTYTAAGSYSSFTGSLWDSTT